MTEATCTRLIETTQSLCPQCMQIIQAEILQMDGAVYMEKTCPAHGRMRVSLWPDAEHYHWMREFSFPYKPPISNGLPAQSCPLDCGLCPSHLRHPTVVEIEVTLRCNLRCPVCFMASSDASADPSLATLQRMYNRILEQVSYIPSLQLTGGEPTVREDLPQILRIGKEMGFSWIEVNTNGIVLARRPDYASQLKDAGATGIYLQFDGVTGDVYQNIRGLDLLETKLEAIENCRTAGLQVVLAMTILSGINHDQIGKVLRFALANNDVVVGLALQPAFTSGRFDVVDAQRLSMGDVLFLIEEQSDGLMSAYDLWPLGCSHPLCSCATYLIKDGDSFTPFTRLISPSEYIAAYDPHSPQGSALADMIVGKGGSIEGGLSVVVMNYMDALTADIKRMKECSMVETMQDGQLIPFCSYQLTAGNGQRLYPAWGLSNPIDGARVWPR